MPRITKTFSAKGGPKDEDASQTVEKSAEDLVGESPPTVIPSTSTSLSVNASEESQDSKSESRDFSASSASGVASPRNDSYTRSDNYIDSRFPVRNASHSDAGGRGNDSGRDVPTEKVSGVLDIMPEGHGFLRPKYIPSDRDVYISASQIRRFWLRAGDLIDGAARPPKETERYFGLLQVNKINGEDANKMVSADGRPIKRVKFEDLTAIYPNRHIKLETGKM